MKKINKKGDYKEVLLDLIVIVGVVAAIFAVVMLIQKNGDESTQDALCRASVILRGKASISLVKGLVEFEKITPLACHTKDVGKLKGSREDVKKQIAEYSSKCWWQFAEGSVQDIFKIDRTEKACFVCYTFTIGDTLDKGQASKIQVYTEPAVDARDKANITGYEVTNFLVSESYNPGVIYGGGTKNYFGQNYVYGLNVGITDDSARTIKPSRITSTLVNGYVMDYSYKITDETKNKINDLGVALQKAGAGNMLVVVADKFSSMENSDARGIIENTGLNSNDTSYDGILVMLDLKSQTMRIHLGSDQSIYVKEYELESMMKKNFDDAAKACASKTDTACNLAAVNKALLGAISDLSDKLLNKGNQLPGISPTSYYYYLSNGGYTWITSADITAPQRYAIAYVAVSDDVQLVGFKKFINGFNTPFNAVTGGFFGNYATKTDRPQFLIISPVNDLGDMCTTVK